MRLLSTLHVGSCLLVRIGSGEQSMCIVMASGTQPKPLPGGIPKRRPENHRKTFLDEAQGRALIVLKAID